VLDSLGATLMVAEIELSDAAAWLGSLPESLSVTGFASLEPAAAALASSMGQHDADGPQSRSGDPVICRIMTKTVLLSLLRAWFDLGYARDWPLNASDPFLDRVIEAIHQDPGRDWTLEALASAGAMSRSAFAQRFRRIFGLPPASYVTGVRMDSAKRMLVAGRSISQTSRELGYASDEGFSRAFRRHTGMTPSTWRSGRSDALLERAAS
jgi:AraC-like DNA-binding protein